MFAEAEFGTLLKSRRYCLAEFLFLGNTLLKFLSVCLLRKNNCNLNYSGSINRLSSLPPKELEKVAHKVF